MKYALINIASRIITNVIILEDPDKYTPIPGFEILTIASADEHLVEIGGTEISGTWNPKPDLTPAELDIIHEALTDKFMTNDKVLALIIFDILKALNNAGIDLSADFSDVTNLTTWRAHVKARIIAAQA